jgi:hypothetical protein
MNSIHYEVRRGLAVITKRDDPAAALSFAEIHSHFPGQLQVYVVEHRERLLTDEPEITTARQIKRRAS